jgi:hypothetical protein
MLCVLRVSGGEPELLMTGVLVLTFMQVSPGTEAVHANARSLRASIESARTAGTSMRCPDALACGPGVWGV